MDPMEDGGLLGPFALTKDQLSKLESVSEVIGTVHIPAPNAVSPNVTVEVDLEGRSAPKPWLAVNKILGPYHPSKTTMAQAEQGFESGAGGAAGSFTPLKAPPKAATPLEKAMGGGTEEEKAEQAELENLAGMADLSLLDGVDYEKEEYALGAMREALGRVAAFADGLEAEIDVNRRRLEEVKEANAEDVRAETQKILDDLRVMKEEADPSLKYKDDSEREFLNPELRLRFKPPPLDDEVRADPGVRVEEMAESELRGAREILQEIEGALGVNPIQNHLPTPKDSGFPSSLRVHQPNSKFPDAPQGKGPRGAYSRGAKYPARWYDGENPHRQSAESIKKRKAAKAAAGGAGGLR